MKPIIIYIGMFIASLLVAIEVVLLVVPHNQKQTVVRVASSQALKVVPKDSLALRTDSTITVHDSVSVAARDTVKGKSDAARELRDSIALLSTRLALEKQKIDSLNERAAIDTTRRETTGSKDMKTMAKLLDSMDAQGAAKILRNLDDKQVKEILLAVKKRQAGKILSSLDPERAARIMR